MTPTSYPAHDAPKPVNPLHFLAVVIVLCSIGLALMWWTWEPLAVGAAATLPYGTARAIAWHSFERRTRAP